MEFEPYLGWIDVPDPNNPPPGARMIGAADLNRYEAALRDATIEFAGLPDRFAAKSHSHSMSQVTGLADAIANTRAQAQTFATSEVRDHRNTTTNIHGISDTANLVYTNDSRLTDARTPKSHSHVMSQVTGLSQAISTAQTNAQNHADTAIQAHSDKTTNVHGIPNTANLVYTNDSRLSDNRTPKAHSHQVAEIVGLSATLGTIQSNISAMQARNDRMMVVATVAESDAPRPITDAVVYWISPVRPTNGQTADLWFNTETTALTALA